MEKKILYSGYVVSQSEAEQLSGASIAGNKMQLNLLTELHKKADLQVFTIYPVATFGKDKRIFYRKQENFLFTSQNYMRVGFINFPIIKQITQMGMLFKEIRNSVKNNPDIILFSYNAYPQTFIPLLVAQIFYKNKLFVLLADLPLDDKVRRSKLSRLAKKTYDRITEYCIRHIQYAVVLNKNVVKQYKLKIPYLVMEGGVNLEDIKLKKESVKEKNIVYTGALTDYSGVLLAVNAMEFIKDKSIKLDIYGSGELETQIKKIAYKSKNIRFHGKKENKEIMEIQRRAWLLINPRKINDPISKVTFPSKIFEYMLSGRPVLSTRLNGFTEEYEDKIIWIENEEPHYLADLIEKLGKDEERLNKLGKRAQDFVVNQKNWTIQSEKIWNFIKTHSCEE